MLCSEMLEARTLEVDVSSFDQRVFDAFLHSLSSTDSNLSPLILGLNEDDVLQLADIADNFLDNALLDKVERQSLHVCEMAELILSLLSLKLRRRFFINIDGSVKLFIGGLNLYLRSYRDCSSFWARFGDPSFCAHLLSCLDIATASYETMLSIVKLGSKVKCFRELFLMVLLFRNASQNRAICCSSLERVGSKQLCPGRDARFRWTADSSR